MMFESRKGLIALKAKPNAKVRVRLAKHDFLFGTGMFDAVPLANESAGDAGLTERVGKILEIDNFGTLPFYWGRFEPAEGEPDTERLKNAALFLRERGITVKGHPLCWHTASAKWLDKYDDGTVLTKLKARIKRDVSGFKGLIDTWDVINEVVIMPIFREDNAVSRLCKKLGRVRMVKEMFEAAREANPDATLLINDFDLGAEYEILIDGCLNAGVPIDAIGLQTHQHQGYHGRGWFEEVLGRFSSFGLPLHFTENTIISGELMPPHIVDLNDWKVDTWPTTAEGEERQARELAEIYTMLFGHPSVEAITTWSPTDHAWLNAPAGFLRLDNSPKPSYDALKKLIREEWTTSGEYQADAEGNVRFEGFKGAYEIEEI